MTATNTSPLNYLVLLGAAELLPKLYGRICAPRADADELSADLAPEAVRQWIAHPPPWLEVIAVTAVEDPSLARLQAGEREAIMLAEQVAADLLLVDERAARREADRRRLATVGTLGILDLAAERGLVDFPLCIERLRQETTFYTTDAILEPLLERDRLRERGKTGDAER